MILSWPIWMWLGHAVKSASTGKSGLCWSPTHVHLTSLGQVIAFVCLIDWLFDCLFTCLFCFFIGWLIDRLIGWWMDGWMDGWIHSFIHSFIHRLFYWLVDCLIGWLIVCFIDWFMVCLFVLLLWEFKSGGEWGQICKTPSLVHISIEFYQITWIRWSTDLPYLFLIVHRAGTSINTVNYFIIYLI